LYWDRQRNEGEPEFAEFLTLLPDPLRDLAVNLFEEAEKLGSPEATLRNSLEYLQDQLRRLDEVRLRTELQNEQEDDRQTELLRQLQARMSKTDIRRLGPR
jgi:hypothetical protein